MLNFMAFTLVCAGLARFWVYCLWLDQNPDHTQSFTTDQDESENLGNRGFLHDSQGIQIPPVPPVGLEPIATNGDCDSACCDGLSAGDHKTDQIGE